MGQLLVIGQYKANTLGFGVLASVTQEPVIVSSAFHSFRLASWRCLLCRHWKSRTTIL